MVSKTKLEKEKEKKKEADESEEYFRQVDKYGPKITIEDIEREESKKKKAKEEKASDLQSRKQLFSYEEKLAKYGQEGLNKIDFPSGWEFYALATYGKDIGIYGRWFKTERGVLFILRSPDGVVYQRGIRTRHDALIDCKAIDILVVQAENTVDSKKGILLSDRPKEKITKSGIILPR